MRSVFGGFLCVCVGLAASADLARSETGVLVTASLQSDTREASPLRGPLPLPRARPANAPQPPLSPQELCDTLWASARQHRIPLAFFGNLIFQESGMRLNVVSRAGARGIAQFMPKTARYVGLRDPFNPKQALPASAKFLRGLLHRFGNNYGLAAAAYNAGPTRVGRWVKRGGALPRETRNYVVKITGKRADEWRGERGQFDHDLTAQLPCANFRVFAELENNPASAHATRPRFILPVPLPNPLRLAHGNSFGTDPEATQPAMNANLSIVMPRAKQPGADETATQASNVVLAAPTPRPAPAQTDDKARTAKSADRLPLPRAHPLRLAQRAGKDSKRK